MVTDVETKMDDNSYILSKTDLRGYITYANNTFIKISAYKYSELIGKNHNIIRHPDMPKAVFKLVWDRIKKDKEFFGFIKNLRKDGGYYWVFAYISADYGEDNEIIGYTSIRRKPPQEAIDAVIPIYKEMIEIEKKSDMQTSLNYLFDLLKRKNISYEEFVLNLQNR